MGHFTAEKWGHDDGKETLEWNARDPPLIRNLSFIYLMKERQSHDG